MKSGQLARRHLSGALEASSGPWPGDRARDGAKATQRFGLYEAFSQVAGVVLDLLLALRWMWLAVFGAAAMLIAAVFGIWTYNKGSRRLD
jgi:hypothetical protein